MDLYTKRSPKSRFDTIGRSSEGVMELMSDNYEVLSSDGNGVREDFSVLGEVRTNVEG